LKRLIIILTALLFVTTSFAQDPEQLIAEANEAYNAGMYEEAQQGYQQVVDAGFASPELFYNLGNTWFKMNQFPHAILWYERAKQLDPGNEDIAYNLNVANSRIADKIDPLPVLFYTRWWHGIVGLFSLKAWAITTVICFSLMLTGVLIYFVSRRVGLRKIGFWGAIIFLGLTIFTFLFSQSAYQTQLNKQEAIIFDPTVTVKSSPDESSVDLFVIHEGTKVELLDKIGEWEEIRIANGSVGWVPTEVLEEI
jgi:tetratricopeptide (TPR) repeat protein